MRRVMLAGALCAAAASAQATTIPVTFTQLTGITGGSPAGTAVYIADISSIGIGQISSVTIQDNSAGIGGAGGQFSGFDLDAIVLSTTLIADATQVGTLVRTGTFDFGSSVFVPGTQRPPPDPSLFGTSAGQVDNTSATLEAFDGNSTTAIPGAAGFVSLGDGGMLSENLTTPLTTGGHLYLYIGEVGNNGEVAASSITVSSERVVPEPASIAVLSIGLGGLGWLRRRRQAR